MFWKRFAYSYLDYAQRFSIKWRSQPEGGYALYTELSTFYFISKRSKFITFTQAFTKS